MQQHGSHSFAGTLADGWIDHLGAITDMIDEADFEEPALIKIEDGQRLVLGVFFELRSAIWDPEDSRHCGGELGGHGFVVGAAIEHFGAAGLAPTCIAVEGNHDVSLVGVRDVVAAGNWRGVETVHPSADDSVAF